MPNKIFIGYRREDSGANALGIGQYLEQEFGRKNVFIDVDMRAGVKFPAVLEERLAECKVMLVLIGPDWLNAKDEMGNRRLDNPDDWVRLEIAQALKRQITVIPVRVNGTPLPQRQALPDDIRGLLDHQAVSVTLDGFRHEMSGLVRDIRAICRPRSRRRLGIVAAATLTLLIAVGITQLIGVSALVERLKKFFLPPAPQSLTLNGVWRAAPGEWILYGTTTTDNAVAFYYNPNSIKRFGDKAVYTARYAAIQTNTADAATSQGSYEDDITVFDCKQPLTLMAEKTVYNTFGDVTLHFKWGDPETLDMSKAVTIVPNSLFAAAQTIVCDPGMPAPLLSNGQATTNNLSYLSGTPNGDGELLFGKKKKISNDLYPIEIPLIAKYYQDHKFSDLLPKQSVRGLPLNYRLTAEPAQLNCKDRKFQLPKLEYYDSTYTLVALIPSLPMQQMEIKEGSPLALLLDLNCEPAAPQVRGTYEGTIQMTYNNVGQGEQKISITVQQDGSHVDVSFRTASGGQGKGSGTLTGAVISLISLQSTAPGCSGSYEAHLEFVGDTVNASYKGEDCGGTMQGRGTAKKTVS